MIERSIRCTPVWRVAGFARQRAAAPARAALGTPLVGMSIVGTA